MYDQVQPHKLKRKLENPIGSINIFNFPFTHGAVIVKEGEKSKSGSLFNCQLYNNVLQYKKSKIVGCVN